MFSRQLVIDLERYHHFAVFDGVRRHRGISKFEFITAARTQMVSVRIVSYVIAPMLMSWDRSNRYRDLSVFKIAAFHDLGF